MAKIEKPPFRSTSKGEVATESESKALARLEAFSDGVFAIGITLLVLEIQIPHATNAAAFIGDVAGQWTAFLAYVVSFLTILVMWLNHHNIVQFINRADRLFFVINGLLLMVIAFVNYPTALVAEASHLGFAAQQFAALMYSGTLVLVAILYNGLWFAAARERRLIDGKFDQATIRIVTIQYSIGIPVYLLAFLLAFVPVVGPIIALAINAALALYFMFTGRIGEAPTRIFARFGGGRS